MDAANELANYTFKLNQVEEALATKPDDQELLGLQTKLKELIVIYTDLVVTTKQPESTDSKKSKKSADSDKSWQRSRAPVFTVGQQVLAKYSGDGNFYKSTVISAPENPLTQPYTVTFHGYGNTEAIFAEDLGEDLEAELEEATSKTAVFDKFLPTTTKRKQQTDEHVATSADSRDPVVTKQKKKGFKSKDAVSKKDLEQMEKQNAWKKFATGSTSKISKKAAVPLLTKHRSIFATPDDPNAKVGVVGSGKPMTQFQQRGKHIYDPEDN
ncbi:hypothetical protein HK096_004506 [Nowakowskiella sp. JEL0078]|nr:hypothetical protein HK096_004506 [Nowakowskiella sp. JEL0078]